MKKYFVILLLLFLLIPLNSLDSKQHQSEFGIGLTINALEILDQDLLILGPCLSSMKYPTDHGIFTMYSFTCPFNLNDNEIVINGLGIIIDSYLGYGKTFRPTMPNGTQRIISISGGCHASVMAFLSPPVRLLIINCGPGITLNLGRSSHRINLILEFHYDLITYPIGFFAFVNSIGIIEFTLGGNIGGTISIGISL